MESNRKFGITPMKMPLAPVCFTQKDSSVHQVSRCYV